MSEPVPAGQAGASPPVTLTAEEKRQRELEESSEASAFLTRLRRGRFLLQLARSLREVTRGVHELRAKGSVVVTLTITPLKNAPGTVTITDKIVAKPPQLDPPATPMFSTPDGALTYEHPDQLSIAGLSSPEGK